MTNFDQAAIDLFKKKAASVSIVVVELKNLAEAMAYAVDICDKKEFCRLLLSDQPGERATVKTLAAPGLNEADYAALAALGQKKKLAMIRQGMREHLSGIDVAFTTGAMGIADTATSVLECPDEDVRLVTMICETHVLTLPKAKIVGDSYQAESYLRGLLAKGPNYASFISGSSRTSDIERVLTTGVHGPLELHVVLLEEE
ncbi:MAG: lactate utilization protein [Candidatus Adiutrix sp.]|nr:lactate utilization protein [Candidatus Adiutrix sp.]